MKNLKTYDEFINEDLVSNGYYDNLRDLDFDDLEFAGFDNLMDKYRFDSLMTNELEEEFGNLIDKSKVVDEETLEEVNGESEGITVTIYKFKTKFFGVCYYAEEDFMVFFTERDAKFWDKSLESVN
jgi:hypothetical protein